MKIEAEEESVTDCSRGYSKAARDRKVDRLKSAWALVGIQEARPLGRRVQVYLALAAQAGMERSREIQPWAGWRRVIGIGHSEFRRALTELAERGAIARTINGRKAGTVTLPVSAVKPTANPHGV